MAKSIICGTDAHDNSLVNQVGVDSDSEELLVTGNTVSGREKLFGHLKRLAEKHQAERIVLGYEAGPLGFCLYDACREAGIQCFVLAPTKMKKSAKEKKNKNDKKNALEILELLRGHLLAGNQLPNVWIPDDATRDDREIVRARLEAGSKLTALKTQVQSLLKRCGERKPKDAGQSWTKGYRAWLATLELERGKRIALSSLLRQIGDIEEEIERLDVAVLELSQTDRYREPCRALVSEIKGVGLLTAMVFLTEMGDLSRFGNRKKVGAYVGLAPSSHDSGETDRKGHITREGSARLRRVTCQASWARTVHDAKEKAFYDRLVLRNPRKKKVAVVACMRRLSILMWRVGLEAQQRTGCYVRTDHIRKVA